MIQLVEYKATLIRKKMPQKNYKNYGEKCSNRNKSMLKNAQKRQE